MKPIEGINMCLHCKVKGCLYHLFTCELQGTLTFSEPCSIQDYMVCPLKSRDDKKSSKEGC
jgi:hypothetical protein